MTVRGEKAELRLLTTPIYRYENPKGDAPDGAAIVFAQGTDPELLLLLETRGPGETRRWHYALARMTIFELEARYADQAVWSARQWERGADPTQPYLTISRQPAD
ncbi:MAG TPA: hypothetical protein VGH74_13910 [Planctomycetaceae bacterium]